MTSFTQVFGGDVVSASEVSYSAITVTGVIETMWPTEIGLGRIKAARVMDLVGDGSLKLPDCTLVSVGETLTFSNVGSSNVTILNYNDTPIGFVSPGTTWVFYLHDNTSPAGAWRSFQLGSFLSVATASSLVGAGMTAIGSLLSPSHVTTNISASTLLADTDRAKVVVWKADSGVLSLPVPSALQQGWFVIVKNDGTNSVTIDPDSSVTVDGLTSLPIRVGESTIIVTDGVEYFTIGYGRDPNRNFTFTTVDLTGGGTRLLTSSEYSKTALRFVGATALARDVIVPDAINEYWVSNQTANAHPITIKTATGSGVVVPNGSAYIVYCDGINVTRAQTSLPADWGAGIIGAQLIPTNTQQQARDVIDTFSRGETVALILALS